MSPNKKGKEKEENEREGKKIRRKEDRKKGKKERKEEKGEGKSLKEKKKKKKRKQEERESKGADPISPNERRGLHIFPWDYLPTISMVLDVP